MQSKSTTQIKQKTIQNTQKNVQGKQQTIKSSQPAQVKKPAQNVQNKQKTAVQVKQKNMQIEPKLAQSTQKNVQSSKIPVESNIIQVNPANRIYRHELKFYINRMDYAMLQSQISALLDCDKHSVDGGYSIRSLYFDDYNQSAYWDKYIGIQHRKKYRIRIYEYSSDLIKLECKIKDGQYVSKDSLTLSLEEYEAIIAGNFDFLEEIDDPLAKSFYIEMKNNGMRPVCIVDYYRQAYTFPIQDVRITFDLDLRSATFEKDLFNPNLLTVPMYPENTSVLEIKFNKFLPEFVRGVLNNAYQPVRSAISKYTMCRAYE